jgi:hypothetical protein
MQQHQQITNTNNSKNTTSTRPPLNTNIITNKIPTPPPLNISPTTNKHKQDIKNSKSNMGKFPLYNYTNILNQKEEWRLLGCYAVWRL